MNWLQLISNKRLGQEDYHGLHGDDRTEFKRDYDRLIFSAPFRRMQNKTQVFPLPGSIFVHNSNTSAMFSHVRRSARYFRYYPSESVTNFFASFVHSLSHIEE